MRYIYIVCCLAVIAWFGHYVFVQAQIRGSMPGATSATFTVTKKWKSPTRGGWAYNIRWEDVAHKDNETNVEEDYWNTLSEGGQVTIIRVGNGDPNVPGNAGIWASDGNIGINVLLILVALGVIIFQFVKIKSGDADAIDFTRDV